MSDLSRSSPGVAVGPGGAEPDVSGATGPGESGPDAGGSGGPLDVLVVGWFPGAGDQIAGRFVADQAAALLATGRVRPSVVSFEPFPLHGDLGLRETAAAAWSTVIREAAVDGRAFAERGAHGPVGVPVARIGAAVGGTRGAGRTNQAIHRATALGQLLDGSRTIGQNWSLVHAHVGYPEGAAVGAVASRRGLPMILTEHATYLGRLFADPDIRAAYLAGAQMADRIVAVSAVLATRITAEFPELTDRVVVIPNTVDIDAFRPVGAADRDPDELLWVGYRREVKGIAVLLKAFRIVRAARPAVRLRLIGRSTTTEEEAGWHTLAAELGIADAVSFEPPADRAGVAAAMEHAALFVHPSRIETMGIVAVEALAAGLPVVAVDSGGVTEVLGDDPDRVGALVPEQQPDALAATIITTLGRRSAFDQHHLRAHVVERYGAAPVAARIADLYAEVLQDFRGVTNAPGGEPQAAARGPAAERRVEADPSIRSRDRTSGMAGDRSVLVVGFAPGALETLLDIFPDDALGMVDIVTGGLPIASRPDAVTLAPRDRDALAVLLGLSGRARGRGWAGIVLAPARWLIRTSRRFVLTRRVLPVLTRTIEQALERGDARIAGRPPVVICLGGIDIVAAEPLRRTGRIVIAPGGARWLGDRRAVQAEAASSR